MSSQINDSVVELVELVKQDVKQRCVERKKSKQSNGAQAKKEAPEVRSR